MTDKDTADANRRSIALVQAISVTATMMTHGNAEGTYGDPTKNTQIIVARAKAFDDYLAGTIAA